MKFKNSTDLILMSFLFLLLIALKAIAGEESTVENLAIKGYDTVAYIKSGKALKGNRSFTLKRLMRTG